MGRKVFVSYKYKDSNVKAISGVMQPTWPCDYVDYIKNKILSGDDVYKGENSDEDISSWSETAIWEHLKSKIYDSTITIVLISPNMKEANKWQRSQWIPWEISFSVRETTRIIEQVIEMLCLLLFFRIKVAHMDIMTKASFFRFYGIILTMDIHM